MGCGFCALTERKIKKTISGSFFGFTRGLSGFNSRRPGGGDLLDAGLVFGTGFAPFRGGPIHYIRASGWARILDRLQRMVRQHGKQFSADRGWEAFT